MPLPAERGREREREGSIRRVSRLYITSASQTYHAGRRQQESHVCRTTICPSVHRASLQPHTRAACVPSREWFQWMELTAPHGHRLSIGIVPQKSHHVKCRIDLLLSPLRQPVGRALPVAPLRQLTMVVDEPHRRLSRLAVAVAIAITTVPVAIVPSRRPTVKGLIQLPLQVSVQDGIHAFLQGDLLEGRPLCSFVAGRTGSSLLEHTIEVLSEAAREVHAVLPDALRITRGA
mmetsp:Transcript_31261/g.77441  ORF Transcript_31261/g.77441 Transcript_31261/m.77441 type:complete len:233 (-) Transcript_31261:440-1138(-)